MSFTTENILTNTQFSTHSQISDGVLGKAFIPNFGRVQKDKLSEPEQSSQQNTYSRIFLFLLDMLAVFVPTTAGKHHFLI